MDVSLDIFWPSFSVEGNNLFYLITEPSLSNPDRGVCRVKQINNVNPLNLRVSWKRMKTDWRLLSVDKRAHSHCSSCSCCRSSFRIQRRGGVWRGRRGEWIEWICRRQWKNSTRVYSTWRTGRSGRIWMDRQRKRYYQRWIGICEFGFILVLKI